MISKENPVHWLQNIVACVRKLGKNDEWKVYFGIACLSFALSLLFALYSAFLNDEQVMRLEEKPVQHLELIEDRTALQTVKEIAHQPAKPVMQPEKQTVADTAGDWYYDELHKDWRYKK